MTGIPKRRDRIDSKLAVGSLNPIRCRREPADGNFEPTITDARPEVPAENPFDGFLKRVMI
jgi:hypothetical protein